MSSFKSRLDKILSEMPIRHFMPAGKKIEHAESEFPNYSYGDKAYFRSKSYEGYTSPKYIEIMSDKLSRLSGYHINIFIIEARSNETRFHDFYPIEDLAEITGLPLSELTDAINFIMTGNNQQTQFSPWLYMHQLGEAINGACGGLDTGGDEFEFQDFYDGMEDLIGPKWIYHLKMGSAREAKQSNTDITDLHQELITEYLWHGGRIRFDYPDNIEKEKVDSLLNIFYDQMKQQLNGLIGKVIINDPGN